MAISAYISLSNNNPQSGQTVTATANVSGQSGAVSYQWKLGSSNVPGATNSTYAYSLSDGENTLSCVVTDSATNVTPVRKVFVGNLSGAALTPVGGTETYTSNITGAKWSTSSIAPNANTISASGVLTKNKVETLILKAFEHGWSNTGGGSYYSINDNGDVVRTVAGQFIHLDASYIRRERDYAEFEIPAYWDNSNLFAVIDGTGGYGIILQGGKVSYALGGGSYADLATGITTPAGAKFRIRLNDGGFLEMLKNGVVIATRTTVAPLADATLGNRVRITLANEPVGTIIKRPEFVSSSVPEKLATKSVSIYAPPPADVTGLIATVVSPTQIDLDWNDVPGATYALEYSVNADFSAAGSITASVSNKSFPGLLPDTRYYFRVKAVKDEILSPNWATLSAQTAAIPDVSGLTISVVSPTQIDLDWNDVSGATYVLEYSVNADYSAAGSASSAVSNKAFPGLQPDIRYFFRVKAVTGGALSKHWAEISAVTPELPSVLDDYFERFLLSEIFNINQLDLEMPVLRANFGDGYEVAALSGKPSGLRYWNISAEVLPDLDEYSVDYVLNGTSETDSRFQYFWEFYRRHLSLGNKPFYFVDPRTNRKFLASFVDNRISFESITAKLYQGGVSIKQRRVKIPEITYRGDDASVSN